MSVIFGLLNFKNTDVFSSLGKMHGACCPKIHNGTRYWYDPEVGLGNILRINTPESVYEKMPYSYNNYVISAYARIDNREILLKQFLIPRDQQSSLTDSYLILKAYDKWGEKCVDYLEGDWAFAIWDKQEKKLFLARDPLGSTGIYYYYSSNYFAFCSSVKGILALPDLEKSPDKRFIAGILTFYLPTGGETPFKNVFFLQPGHSLAISSSRFDKKRYFVIEETKEIHYKCLEDYILNFLELYKNSIKSRLRSIGSIGCTLSGGLDSGSIAALTARELKSSSRSLQAFTYCPFNKTISFDKTKRFVDESRYAKAIADFYGNIDITFVSGEQFSVINELEEWDRITVSIRPPTYCHEV